MVFFSITFHCVSATRVHEPSVFAVGRGHKKCPKNGKSASPGKGVRQERVKLKGLRLSNWGNPGGLKGGKNGVISVVPVGYLSVLQAYSDEFG